MLFIIFAVLFVSTLCDVKIKSDYDFFFPGTEFTFSNLGGCTGEECKLTLLLNDPSEEEEDNADASLLGGFHRVFGDSSDGPITEFPLTRISEYTYILENVDSLPDAKEMGIYPNCVIRIDSSDETIGYLTAFTFYKSQSYMKFDDDDDEEHVVNINVESEGAYSLSLENENYRPSVELNTHFNVSGADELYIKVNYEGVKQCDHLTIYNHNRDGQVLGLPTIFNSDKHTESKIPFYFYARDNTQFQTEFVSDDNFSYSAYPPVVEYSGSYEPDESTYGFVDVDWSINKSDNSEIDVDEERLHFNRGDKIDVTATMRINDSLIEYLSNIDVDKEQYTGGQGVFLIFSICHVRRQGDVWSNAYKDACDDSEYVSPPPYGCTISGKYNINDGTMEFTQSESTRHIGDEPYKLEDYDYDYDDTGDFREYTFNITNFDTEESNPIPFRLVPLVSIYDGVDEEDSNILKYRFVPLGPASEIYEIDLDTTSALIFFIVVFSVVVVLCVLSYFIGGIIVKKVNAKKAAQAKRITDENEESNNSLVDSHKEEARESNEDSLDGKKEPSEKDKLLNDQSTSN